MVEVIKDSFEYIRIITSQDIKTGEVYCLNFLPSALFPKDIINYFYHKKDYIEKHDKASVKLWNYGKKQLKKLEQEEVTIGVELKALQVFISNGIVHEASPNFEVSLSIRIDAIDQIIRNINNVFFIPEPIPYTFRLIPPNTIILDVAKNTSSQLIQGIQITDDQAYKDFQKEFERLQQISSNRINKSDLANKLIDAKSKLSSGFKAELDII
jgi:hypothetical protein